MDLEELEQPPIPKLVDEVFPLEIWNKIFTYLHSAQDLLSIFDTSQVLRELLNPKKVFPLIFPHLSSERVLNCRSINYQWSEVVDDFFKFHPPHNDNGILSSPIEFPYHPIFKPLPIEMIRQLIDSPINPFAVTRYLSYHEESDFLQPVYSERGTLISLVEKFGSEIWHFNLNIKNFNNHDTCLLNMIRSCLRFMPNLKTVSIFAVKSPKFVAETGPDAPQLDRVVKLSTNIKGILDIGRLVANSNLKQLRTEELHPKMEMRNLEHLHTNVISRDDLHILRALKSPLKVLKLTAGYCFVEVDLVSIFQTVGHHDSTLREFYLEYYVRDEQEMVPSLELPLPMLQKVELNVGNYRLLSVDFLLPCVALESLSVVCCDSFTDNCYVGEQLPAIKFLGFESSMYGSNIWERLPKLQVIQVKDRTRNFEYNRSDWETWKVV